MLAALDQLERAAAALDQACRAGLPKRIQDVIDTHPGLVNVDASQIRAASNLIVELMESAS